MPLRPITTGFNSLVHIAEKYPANLIRLRLIIKRLNENKSKKVLDAGCGSAIPMIKLLKKGFDVRGFDFTKQMVDFGKYELKSAKYSMPDNKKK